MNSTESQEIDLGTYKIFAYDKGGISNDKDFYIKT